MTRYVEEFAKDKGLYYCLSCQQKLEDMEIETYKKSLSNVMIFYLRSRPLIEAGKLFPYVDVRAKMELLPDKAWEEVIENYDEEVAGFLNVLRKNKESIEQASKDTSHPVNDTSDPFFREYFSLVDEKRLALLAVNNVLFSDSVPAPSIDFLGHISDGVFRSLIRLSKHIANPNQGASTLIYSTREQHFSIPTLTGVAIQEIPEILEKEGDALQQLRAFLETKISSVSEPYGTTSWDSQISSIRAALKRDLIEIERTLEHIKRDHIKKQAENVLLMSFSITLATLGLMHQSLDPVSAIQSIVGGAGLTASLKGVIDSLLEYQDKVNEQKRKDAYFLWRLKKNR